MSLNDERIPEETIPEPMYCEDCELPYTAHREADYEECPRCDGMRVWKRDAW